MAGGKALTSRIRKDPHRITAGRRRLLASLSGSGAAGVPTSLPPMPAPGTEPQHWYKGWETGPGGERSCRLQGRLLWTGSAAPLFYPDPVRAGVPARGSGAASKRAGRGRDRSEGGTALELQPARARPTPRCRTQTLLGGVRGAGTWRGW